jgi:hypothetical protein
MLSDSGLQVRFKWRESCRFGYQPRSLNHKVSEDLALRHACLLLTICLHADPLPYLAARHRLKCGGRLVSKRFFWYCQPTPTLVPGDRAAGHRWHFYMLSGIEQLISRLRLAEPICVVL